jgi:hypothetical protein
MCPSRHRPRVAVCALGAALGALLARAACVNAHGLDASRVQVEIRCSIDGTWTVRSLIAPWAQCRAGGCNSTYQTYEATFTNGQAALAPLSLTARTYRGQPWEPQQAEYDGASTITLWHLDYFCGDRVGARFSLGGQYLGLVAPSCE